MLSGDSVVVDEGIEFGFKDMDAVSSCIVIGFGGSSHTIQLFIKVRNGLIDIMKGGDGDIRVGH